MTAPVDLTDRQDVEDELEQVISDSIDMDWNARTGARAILSWLDDHGFAIVPVAPIRETAELLRFFEQRNREGARLLQAKPKSSMDLAKAETLKWGARRNAGAAAKLEALLEPVKLGGVTFDLASGSEPMRSWFLPGDDTPAGAPCDTGRQPWPIGAWSSPQLHELKLPEPHPEDDPVPVGVVLHHGSKEPAATIDWPKVGLGPVSHVTIPGVGTFPLKQDVERYNCHSDEFPLDGQ